MSDEPPELSDSVPEITRTETRGAAQLLNNLGQGLMTEFSLATGHRVDVIGVDRVGHVTVIDVKASVADFKSDRKWTKYLEFCDSFFFAVVPTFPARCCLKRPAAA